MGCCTADLNGFDEWPKSVAEAFSNAGVSSARSGEAVIFFAMDNIPGMKVTPHGVAILRPCQFAPSADASKDAKETFVKRCDEILAVGRGAKLKT